MFIILNEMKNANGWPEPAKGRGKRGTGPGYLFAGAPKRLSKSITFLIFHDNGQFFI